MSYSELAETIEAADEAEARGDLVEALRLTRVALELMDQLEADPGPSC